MTRPRKFCFGLRSKIIASTVDFFHIFFPKKAQNAEKFERILLCNWGSFGDLYLAISTVSAIKNKYPDCKIGLLISPNQEEVITSLEGIDWVHFCPYPLRAKNKLLRLGQFLFYAFGKKELCKEIESVGYDICFELYPFFPNSIPLAYRANIPQRIGFNTSGNYRLLTHCVNWEKDQYLTGAYSLLLKKMGIEKSLLNPPVYAEERNAEIIFHMGSSDPKKELPIDFWKDLYALFKKAGLPVRFTGNGPREKALIDAISTQNEESLCNKLSWKAFAEKMQSAPLVITVDSVSSHLAAAGKTPLIIFYLFNPNVTLWKPAGENVVAYEKIPSAQEVFKRGMEIKYEVEPLHTS